MFDSSPLRLVVLGSGSAGNASVITDGATTLLIDCGFSAREVSRRMLGCGLEPSTVDAVLVTHEHGDHTRGLEVFCRRHALSAVVYTSAGTRRNGQLDARVCAVESIASCEPFRVGNIEVVPFATSHDAAEPLGFRFSAGACSVGFITDSGVVTDQAAEALAGCDVMAIESNHDVEMLAKGPYPAHLKRRIHSRNGHLSNEQAASALERCASDRLRSVIGLHRSRTNNTSRLALAGLTERISQLGLGTQATVTVAEQDRPVDSKPAQGQLFSA